MADDTILSHAEALAEIERLRERVTELEAESDRLRASLNSVIDQKADLLGAIARGTLAAPTPDDDQPAIVHNVPPNAPR